jgi:adenosylcobinamide-phosphate synthase
MGRWLNWGRRLSPQRYRFWFGTGWTLAGLLLFTLPWWWLEELEGGRRRSKKGKQKTEIRKSFVPYLSSIFYLLSSAFLHPFLLKPIFAYRNLRRAVMSVAEALVQHNLAEARRLLGWHLVSRDTSNLSEAEVVGAAIESLAENLTDSLTAPLLAYAIGGLPVAWGYRFVNTADAMWGYRTSEFEQLGKFPARLDDILNWLPARLTGWLLVVAAWLVGADARRAARTMLTQHRRTPSPNAGWTMSAMAGALGVTLNKRGVYELEGGPGRLDVAAIRRAVRLADVGAGISLILAVQVGATLAAARGGAGARPCPYHKQEILPEDCA